MNYTLDEGVEGSIKGFGVDFNNEEETETRCDDRENKETLELNRKHDEQANRQ
jgi:hypothetical protein